MKLGPAGYASRSPESLACSRPIRPKQCACFCKNGRRERFNKNEVCSTSSSPRLLRKYRSTRPRFVREHGEPAVSQRLNACGTSSGRWAINGTTMASCRGVEYVTYSLKGRTARLVSITTCSAATASMMPTVIQATGACRPWRLELLCLLWKDTIDEQIMRPRCNVVGPRSHSPGSCSTSPQTSSAWKLLRNCMGGALWTARCFNLRGSSPFTQD